MIRVAIVDDHAVVLDGIISFLQVREDIEVVGKATSGEELFALLEHNEVDIVISDYRMPEMNGTELLQKIRSQYPEIKVIIFTIVREQKVMAELVRNGAVAFLNKNSSGKELIDTIYTVHKGKVSFDIDVFQSAIPSRVLDFKKLNFNNQNRRINNTMNSASFEYSDDIYFNNLSFNELDVSTEQELPDIQAEIFRPQNTENKQELSQRETEILKLLEQGLSVTDVANQLSRSENTIRSHTQTIRKKLNAKSTRKAIYIAQKNNLI